MLCGGGFKDFGGQEFMWEIASNVKQIAAALSKIIIPIDLASLLGRSLDKPESRNRGSREVCQSYKENKNFLSVK